MSEAQLKIVATRGDSEFREDVPLAELPALLAALDEHGWHIWIDSWGADNPEAVRLAKQVFCFHPLAVDDCFGKREHPKVEAFEGHVFLITHGVAAGATADRVDTVELDVFIGRNFLFTYHEQPSRSIAGAMDLVTRTHGAPLRRGMAHVLHAILDRQVDSMEPLLDDLEERVQAVEDRVLVHPGNDDLAWLLALKRTTLQLRRWMTRQREVLLRLARNEFDVVCPTEAILFRDVYDHLFRFTDLLENNREMITSLQESYLSVTNLRLGEIMKFLTLFTAVLMPLTVITGIYGMNFEQMPELKQWWGYPGVLVVMAVIAGIILMFFRRRGWLGGPARMQEVASLPPTLRRSQMNLPVVQDPGRTQSPSSRP
jgi:magnesium transporter